MNKDKKEEVKVNINLNEKELFEAVQKALDSGKIIINQDPELGASFIMPDNLSEIKEAGDQAIRALNRAARLKNYETTIEELGENLKSKQKYIYLLERTCLTLSSIEKDYYSLVESIAQDPNLKFLPRDLINRILNCQNVTEHEARDYQFTGSSILKVLEDILNTHERVQELNLPQVHLEFLQKFTGRGQK